MSTRVWKVLGALMLAILIMLICVESAAAQEPITRTISLAEPTVYGVDLVFLLDQSGSMFKEIDENNNVIGPGNDPNGLRVNSVKFVLTVLGYDNLYQHPEAEHRIGVVSFGGENASTIDIPLTSLKTTTEEEWQTRLRDLTSRLRLEQRGETHFIEAFEQAQKIFQEAGPAPEPRAKGIILLTDGRPHIHSFHGILVSKDEEYNPEFLKEYMRNGVAPLVKDHFPLAPDYRSPEGYHIWVVALNAAEDYWTPPFTTYWQEIVGDQWVKVGDNNAIPKVFNDILEKIYQTCWRGDTCYVPGRFAMPPYVARAVFSVLAMEPITKPEDFAFTRADGSKVQRDDDDVLFYTQFGETIQHWEFDRPTPGFWGYEKRPDLQVDVRFDPLFGTIKLMQPSGEQIQLSKASVVYQMYDRNGNIMEEAKGLEDGKPITYPLKLAVSLMEPGPDGRIISLTMKYIGEGKYQSDEEISLLWTGTYRLSVSGTAVDDENQEIEVFKPVQHTFSVRSPEITLKEPRGLQTPLSLAPVVYELREADLGVAEAPGVEMRVTITNPKGYSEERALYDRGRGRLESDQPIALLYDGTYRLGLTGTVVGSDGKRITFYSKADDQFTVDTIRPVFVVPQGLQLPFHRLSVTYQLQTGRGDVLQEDPGLPLSVILTVIPPAGSPITQLMTSQGNGRYTTAQPVSLFQAGTYKLRLAGTVSVAGQKPVEVFSAEGDTLATGTLQATMTEPAIEKPQYTQVEIVYEVRTADGQLFIEDPQHPLTMKATVTTPDKTQEEVLLARKTDGVYGGTLLARKEGAYQVTLLGTGLDSTGKPVEAVRDERGQFSTYPTTAVYLAIDAPSDGDKSAIRTKPQVWPIKAIGRPLPLTIRVHLEDEQGRPIAPAEITTAPVKELLTANLLGPQGKPWGGKLEFAPDPSDPNSLVATADGLDQVGEYTLQVSLAAMPRREYIPVQDAAQVAFERYDPTVRLTRAIMGGQAALTAAILAFIVYLGYLFTSPVRGQLVFTGAKVSGGKSTLPLARGRRIVKIGKGKLSQYGVSELSKVKAQRIGRTEDGKELIKLWVWDTNKEEIVPGEEWASGESAHVCDGVRAHYEV